MLRFEPARHRNSSSAVTLWNPYSWLCNMLRTRFVCVTAGQRVPLWYFNNRYWMTRLLNEGKRVYSFYNPNKRLEDKTQHINTFNAQDYPCIIIKNNLFHPYELIFRSILSEECCNFFVSITALIRMQILYLIEKSRLFFILSRFITRVVIIAV